MLLVIDNYDSFTYNLVQYLAELGAEVEVYRNDRITVDDALDSGCRALVVSPGPGVPGQAGISLELVRRAAGRLPVLGVCLGHQTIAESFGGKIVPARELVHGKASDIHHDGRTRFRDLPDPFPATRYHSLTVERASFPEMLEVSAWTEDGTIMGLRHRELPIEGVQFHPESVLTAEGKRLLANWLEGLSAGSG